MDSHHALLFVNSTLEALPIESIYKKPSQDVTHVFVDRFGIDDARALSAQAFQKPVSFSKRVFVLSIQDITTEAQNALLKLFEEPPATALFYVLVQREGVLLPTLRSRLQLITTISETENNEDVSFFELNRAQQLEHIAVLAKEKNKDEIEHLLHSIEKLIASEPTKYAQTLHSLLFARSYIGTPGASAKMLLEELVLSLPSQ